METTQDGARGDVAAGAVERFPPEVEHGNVEYKLQLATTSCERRDKLTSQMKWRIGEGDGEAIYRLGVADNGTPTGISAADMKVSIRYLREMAASLDCKVVEVTFSQALQPRCSTARVVVRRNPVASIPSETRVLMMGFTGVGKTSLVGVLKTDDPDDGNGRARLHVLRHQHELDLGQTSSVSWEALRYDLDGNPIMDTEDDQDVPCGIFTDNAREHVEGSDEISQMVTLIDAAGHPRFIKSMIYSLMALNPDHALVVVDPETLAILAAGNTEDPKVRGARNMLCLCEDMELPFVMVVCKSDRLDAADMTAEDAERLARALAGREEVQVLLCSNTTMQGIDEIREFVATVPSLDRLQHASEEVNMYVREAFDILGFDGAILGGILESGTVRLNDHLVLGPDHQGGFHPVIVKSIRTEYGLSVNSVSKGHTATFGVCLRSVQENGAGVEPDHDAFHKSARRGALLTNQSITRRESRTFEVRVLRWMRFNSEQPFTFDGAQEKTYHFTVRCMTIKQSAVLKRVVSKDVLELEFSKHPEHLPSSARMILHHSGLVLVAQHLQLDEKN